MHCSNVVKNLNAGRSPFMASFIIFCVFSIYGGKRQKTCFSVKKWFWPANGMRSTHSLVKIHNNLVYKKMVTYPAMNKDSSKFPKLDICKSISSESESSSVSNHDGAWTSGNAGLDGANPIKQNFLTCA